MGAVLAGAGNDGAGEAQNDSSEDGVEGSHNEAPGRGRNDPMRCCIRAQASGKGNGGAAGTEMALDDSGHDTM